MTKIPKQMLTYDKHADFLYFIEQETYSFKKYMRNLNESEERFQLYRATDFPGASVLDIGCSHGCMLTEAAKAGAARTVGIEHSPGPAADAMNAGHEIHMTDVEDLNLWRERLPLFDVVMFLAVWHTSRMSDRFALLSRALSVCSRVFYWDGHPGESANERLKHLLLYSNFTTFEFMGEMPSRSETKPRSLIRASYDQPSESSVAITTNSIITTWKELHLPCQ